MTTKDENPKSCKTCNNIECKYFKYKDTRYGVYDNEFNISLVLTPSSFTAIMGCASWIGDINNV